MSELLDATDAEDQTAEIRRRGAAVPPIRPTDGERLMRFCRYRDEAAFAEVVEIHAALVWGVCSQVLRHRQDVEDAFQATFLILARKAKSIRACESAAGWLYRVAFRTALLARNRRGRRAAEPLYDEPVSDDDQFEAIARNEQCRVLLEELHALPLQYRQPLVLCYLEGRSRSEAADELGMTPQSVKGRLARGTRLLRSRMVSRGTALSTTMAVVTAAMASAQAQAAPALVSTTAALGASFAMKFTGAAARATSAKGAATVLAEKGILAMTIAAAAKPAVVVLGVCLTAGMFAVATADGPQGDGAGGSPVILLADADTGDELSASALEVTADSISEVAENESDFGLEGSENDERDMGYGNEPFTASALAAVTTEPAATAATPVIIAPPGASATVTIPGGGTLRPTIIREEMEQPFRFPAPAPPLQFTATRTSLPATAAPSEKSLALEAEYWEIKSKALKQKAEALLLKAESITEDGSGAKTEILEAQADAGLALAEVKLCEVNAQRIKESLEAAEAGKLKVGSKGVQVRLLQQALNSRVKPSPKLDVDGDFGPLTRQVVVKFQKANGLDASGVVDVKTFAALGQGAENRFELPLPPTGLPGMPEAVQPPKMNAMRSVAGGRGGAVAAARQHAAKAESAVKAKSAREAKVMHLQSLREAVDSLQKQIEAVEIEAQDGGRQ
jgi:RNA polymerase sigma factor (sigma-70 family)